MKAKLNRREFVTVLGGAASALPLAARAQQPEGMRRIGVLIGLAETDNEVEKYLSELRKTLRALGWIEGKNLWIDHRAAADLGGMRSHALTLVKLGAESLHTLVVVQKMMGLEKHICDGRHIFRSGKLARSWHGRYGSTPPPDGFPVTADAGRL
jgi:hypothetical protein